jgi:hypothetical protein
MTRLRWDGDLAVLNGQTVVGTVEEIRSDEWQAWGCVNDLNDIDLGCWRSCSKAKEAVKRWVKENTEE